MLLNDKATLSITPSWRSATGERSSMKAFTNKPCGALLSVRGLRLRKITVLELQHYYGGGFLKSYTKNLNFWSI